MRGRNLHESNPGALTYFSLHESLTSGDSGVKEFQTAERVILSSHAPS